MNTRLPNIVVMGLAIALPVAGLRSQDDVQTDRFQGAGAELEQRLRESVEELNAERKRIAELQLPLAARVTESENALIAIRKEFLDLTRQLDSRVNDVNNLRKEVEQRRAEIGYLSNSLDDYVRNFEARLHITELQRYSKDLETVKLAPESPDLTQREIFGVQAGLLATSLDRLEDLLGGAKFAGSAVAPNGLVSSGNFVVFGPVALFGAERGGDVGLAEQRLGSTEPTVIPYSDPAHTALAAELVRTGEGQLPLDASLGNAFKIEQTNETWLEHVKAGGVVMIPIFVLAGLALLVALWKWLTLSLIRRPSKRQVTGLLDAVRQRDQELAIQKAKSMPGPAGAMLSVGAENLGETTDLIEEVMYEKVMATRLRANGLLPFIAICAASAPLLGLLGTVTGIIETFKNLTVFGSGDVKSLSGGISKALITTEYGLIVAIPSLLLHAFLSRKAKAIVGHMERVAVAFSNQVAKTPLVKTATTTETVTTIVPDQDLVRGHVREVLQDLLGPMFETDRNGGSAAGRVSHVG